MTVVETIIIRISEFIVAVLWAAVAVGLAWAVARWVLSPDYVALVVPDPVRGSLGRIGS